MSYSKDIADTLHGLAGSVNPYREHTRDQSEFEKSRQIEFLKVIAVVSDVNADDFALLANTLAKTDPRLTTVLATVIEDFCRLCIDVKRNEFEVELRELHNEMRNNECPNCREGET